MTAPFGMPRSSVRGGGDCRTLLEGAVAAMEDRSSTVDCGVKGLADPLLMVVTEGVRRCLFRYEAERGRDGRWPDCEERRLASGEADAEEAGDRFDGGV